MTDIKTLDNVTDKIVLTIENSRDNINNYVINIRNDRENILAELAKLKKKIQDTIEQIAQLQVREKQSKLNLIEICKNNHRNFEADFLEAYENARELQISLGLMLEREKQLKVRRDQLDTDLKKLDESMENSHQMLSRTGVAMDYLLGNLYVAGKKNEEIPQRQMLGLKIILAQEEERRRVAREIHDGPAQSMANLVLRTEICEKIMDTKPGEVKEELRELKIMVRNSLQEIRKIIFDLRPMALDDLGLIATLKRFLEDFRDKTALSMDFSSSGVSVKENKDLEIAVFRIVQEAMNNVVKHAEASEVMVSVDFKNDHIDVRVRDNGRGFDTADKHPKGSYGLMGMKERIELLEGTMKVNSAAGKGTEVWVTIPLKANKNS